MKTFDILHHMKFTYLVAFAVFFAIQFGLYTNTLAALLYFDPADAVLHRGDTMSVALRIDTDTDECINTIESVIHFDPAVKVIDLSRGRSILNLWVENPKINEEENTVTFAGGIPGGYCGRIPGDPSLTNIVLELILRSPGFSVRKADSGLATLRVDPASQILLNDGFGTPATLRTIDATITMSDTPGSSLSDTWQDQVQDDTDLPSDFSIVLTRDETAFSGDYFITFNALDKQSGIDHYEVMEEPFTDFYAFRWGRADAPWIVTESPYVLKDQSLNSTIRVKAIDKAGNQRIAIYVPDVALRSVSFDKLLTLVVIGGAVLLVIILAVIGYMQIRKRARIVHTQTGNQDE